MIGKGEKEEGWQGTARFVQRFVARTLHPLSLGINVSFRYIPRQITRCSLPVHTTFPRVLVIRAQPAVVNTNVVRPTIMLLRLLLLQTAPLWSFPEFRQQPRAFSTETVSRVGGCSGASPLPPLLDHDVIAPTHVSSLKAGHFTRAHSQRERGISDTTAFFFFRVR